jgi:hypothetical protein
MVTDADGPIGEQKTKIQRRSKNNGHLPMSHQLEYSRPSA